jgi:hypothetical protein
MYFEPPRHPRAGVALGLAILAAWLAALGVALLTGDPADERRGPPAAGAIETTIDGR